MRRLTKTQINHLTSRIETTLRKLAAKEIAKLGKPPKLIEYNDDQKLFLIRSGTAKLREDINRMSLYDRLFNFFVFPETAEMKKARIAREQYDDAIRAINEFYQAEKQRLIDQAILGDSTEALQMLRELELKLELKK